MSLNGTLETFALPDVLALLSATKKTGELKVDGGRGEARVWLSSGEMIGADVPRATTFVDALFEMLRLTSGSFAFENDGKPSDPSEPMAIEPLLREAQSRLGEWKSIEAVVPSISCGVKLAATVSQSQVSVTAEQWRALVAVASNPDVEGVLTSLGLGEFVGCRMLKDLVQIGLVSIEEAPVTAPAPEPEALDPSTRRPSPQPRAPRIEIVPEGEEKAPAPVETGPRAPQTYRPQFHPVTKPVLAPEMEVVIDSALEPRPAAAKPAARGVSGSDAVAPARTSGNDAARPAARGVSGSDVVAAAGTPQGNDVTQPAPRAAKASEPLAESKAEEAGQSPAQLVHELAALQGDEESSAVRRVGGTIPKPVDKPAEKADEASGEDPSEDDEPLNRGLLLKFLNSVRS